MCIFAQKLIMEDLLVFRDSTTISGVTDSGIENIIIPSGVVVIGKNAFRDCCNLKRVIIPDSVKK